MDDLFEPLTPANPAAVARKCSHPRASRSNNPVTHESSCLRCGHVFDPERMRRGRSARSRGQRIQRERITRLGGENIAGNKPGHDGRGLAFEFESKSGGFFSERVWRVLSAIPTTADTTAVLIVSEAPGGAVGRRARSYVVVDYDAWLDLHGEVR